VRAQTDVLQPSSFEHPRPRPRFPRSLLGSHDPLEPVVNAAETAASAPLAPDPSCPHPADWRPHTIVSGTDTSEYQSW
jgi:hypothetical protein